MADNRPKKILVAEDTDSNFLLVSIILRKEYTVLRAYNGIEAIDVYKKEQPDLILIPVARRFVDIGHHRGEIEPPRGRIRFLGCHDLALAQHRRVVFNRKTGASERHEHCAVDDDLLSVP